MMAIKPDVRYMLLCDDWRLDPSNAHRITIVGLISMLRSAGNEPYPLLCEEMCVFLVLTEGYGQGQGQIACIDEETGERVFERPPV